MKRRRTMLLCVTATSMAAAVACSPAGHPVGIVGGPDRRPEPELDAGAAEDDAGDGAVPTPADVAPVADAGKVAPVADAGKVEPVKVGKVATPRDAGLLPPDFHPDRVGTTANVDDSPTVGTTARVPDKKK